MNRKTLISFFVVPMLLIMAGSGMAGVNVNINIGLPPVYRFAEPPELVVIPNTYVYFAPGIDLDIVFYHGYWYRPYNGYWYRGAGYNGPWRHIDRKRIPRYIIDLPPDFRLSYREHPRIPYGHVRSNWNRWEREKYWDKREWKHEQNEWKQKRKADRREAKQERHQDVRQDRQDRRQDRREVRQDRRDQREDRREDRQR